MKLSQLNGTEANLILRYDSEKVAAAISEAVSPDNLLLPQGLSLNIEIKKTEVSIHIRCEKGVASLIATLDDLFRCISAAEKTIEGLA